MPEFEHSWEFSQFQRELWDFLDQKLPIPPAPYELAGTVTKLHLSVAETMVSRGFLGLDHASKKYPAIVASLRKQADQVGKTVLDTSNVAGEIRRAANMLEEQAAFSAQYFEQHGRANWLARYVAEQCAQQYYAATGKKLTFYSGRNNIPTTPFGRLVKEAIEFMGVRADKKKPCSDGSKILADWRRPTQDVVERFDYECRGVKDWA